LTLLVEAELFNEKRYISNEPKALFHYWDPFVLKMNAIKYAMASNYGGYVKVKYGNISISPEFFSEKSWPLVEHKLVWPPPDSVDFLVKYTDSTEESAITLLEATGHLGSVTRSAVEYKLYGDDYSEVMTNQLFSGSLLSILQTYTGSSHLNLELDSTFARDPSPAVNYTASGELLSILSDICKFFSHFFYIKRNKLYLVDMLQSSGSVETDESEFLPVIYRGSKPYSSFESGGYSVAGSASYGDIFSVSPTCHGTQSNIEAALSDIKTIVEKKQLAVPFPMTAEYVVDTGNNITFVDNSLLGSTSASMYARSITYDFDKDEFLIDGEGEIQLNL
jgi:hypothetical protein